MGKATDDEAGDRSTADRLVALILGITPADVAELDETIEAKRAAQRADAAAAAAEIESLVRARDLAAKRLGVELIRKSHNKPKSKPPPPAASRLPAPAADQLEAWRKAAAIYLGESGPRVSSVVADACQIPVVKISTVLDCDAFEGKPGQGFRLTATGRKRYLGG